MPASRTFDSRSIDARSAWYAANEHVDLVIRRGGGGMWPAHAGRSTPADFGFFVDGPLVASCFATYLEKAIAGALTRSELGLGDIQRFYLHQANKRVLESFIADEGIPLERVAMHMHRYGNTPPERSFCSPRICAKAR